MAPTPPTMPLGMPQGRMVPTLVVPVGMPNARVPTGMPRVQVMRTAPAA